MKQKGFAHLGRKLCAVFMACAMVLATSLFQRRLRKRARHPCLR